MTRRAADLAALCSLPTRTIRDAMAQLDHGRRGIVLVVDRNRRLVGTVTDGDIRRALLDRVELEEPVSALLARKAGTPYAQPVTAPADAAPATLLRLLQEHRILHLPLLDAQRRVTGLARLDDFLPNHSPVRAVVMAGGQGSRLVPLTEELPKPMLPVGGKPVMEILIEQLRQAGIKHVNVTTHHKSEKISEHFGDGSGFGVALSYTDEREPLGTVGGLGLLQPPTETTLVINGDIVTEVDFRAMVAYHHEQRADLTMAVRHYGVQVPYGVVECDGPLVRRVREKPEIGFFVNAGMYLLEPVAYTFIPQGQRFDMTELIQRLVADGRRVVSFPVREYWLDIGQHEDYRQAQQDYAERAARPSGRVPAGGVR